MTREVKRNRIGAIPWAISMGLALAAALSSGLAAAETGGAKQVLELTGGRRVKVVWNQGDNDRDHAVRYFDTKDGVIRHLPISGTQPLLTPDGRRVLAVAGTSTDRKLVMYDTETGETTTLSSGPDSYLLAIWRDPKTGRDWVYVNDSGAGGDRQRPWDAGRDTIFRFPLDQPEARELFWDRTTSHEFLMFSADGTRACFSTTFSNIGEMKFAFDDQGRIDQDNATFKSVGGGCFPGMAPDNSYRLFRLDGDHHTITMFDADLANPRKIRVSDIPGVAEKGRNVWLTRWSTHPRYFTLVGPAPPDARIWIGRFDDQFTRVEAWAQVNSDGPQCWKSHAWVEPER